VKKKYILPATVAATFLYLFFLIATTPASWIVVGIERAGLPVEVTATNGTIWYGNANVMLHPVQNKAIDLGAVRWKTNPLYLLIGKIGLTFSVRDTEHHAAGRAIVGLHSIRFHHLEVTLPFTTLYDIYPPASLSGIRGIAKASLNNLLLSTEQVAVAGEIRMDRLVSNMFGPDPFGSYLIVLSSKNNELLGKIRTNEGKLMVDGSGSWKPMKSGEAQFDGTVKSLVPNPGIDTLVRQLGKPTANGGVRIQWKGHITPPVFK
jgi:hypothetical protein